MNINKIRYSALQWLSLLSSIYICYCYSTSSKSQVISSLAKHRGKYRLEWRIQPWHAPTSTSLKASSIECSIYGVQALISVWSDWLHVSSHVHSECRWLSVVLGWPCLAVNTHRLSVFSVWNDVSNVEKCVWCFVKVFVWWFAKSVRVRMCVQLCKSRLTFCLLCVESQNLLFFYFSV